MRRKDVVCAAAQGRRRRRLARLAAFAEALLLATSALVLLVTTLLVFLQLHATPLVNGLADRFLDTRKDTPFVSISMRVLPCPEITIDGLHIRPGTPASQRLASFHPMLGDLDMEANRINITLSLLLKPTIEVEALRVRVGNDVLPSAKPGPLQGLLTLDAFVADARMELFPLSLLGEVPLFSEIHISSPHMTAYLETGILDLADAIVSQGRGTPIDDLLDALRRFDGEGMTHALEALGPPRQRRHGEGTGVRTALAAMPTIRIRNGFFDISDNEGFSLRALGLELGYARTTLGRPRAHFVLRNFDFTDGTGLEARLHDLDAKGSLYKYNRQVKIEEIRLARLSLCDRDMSTALSNLNPEISSLYVSGGLNPLEPSAFCDLRLQAQASLRPLSTHVYAALALTNGSLPEEERSDTLNLMASGSLRGFYVFDAPIPFLLQGVVAPWAVMKEAEIEDHPPYEDILPAMPTPNDWRIQLSRAGMGMDEETLKHLQKDFPSERALFDAIVQDAVRSDWKLTGSERLETILSDSGSLDATLLLPDGNGAGKPSLTGRLALTHLSLTRWLGFSRDMIPGLQITLDDITEGILDFTMDGEGLRVPRVSGIASDSQFSGIGGVAAWSRPVVFLDMHNTASEGVDLGAAIPETLATLPMDMAYAHRPLTSLTIDEFLRRPTNLLDDIDVPEEDGCGPSDEVPACELAQRVLPIVADRAVRGSPALAPLRDEEMPRKESDETSEKSETFDIGYDIRLAADKVRYGRVTFNSTRVAIHPTEPNAKGESYCQLAVTTRLYGGNLKGGCIVAGDKVPTYRIWLDGAGVQAAPLQKALDVVPLSKGTISGSVAVRSDGGEIDVFLDHLHGTASIAMKDGTYALPGNAFALSFGKSSIDLSLGRAFFKDKRLGLDGKWKGQISCQGWSATASLDGALRFGGSGTAQGMSVYGAGGEGRLKGVEHFLPGFEGKDVLLEAKGSFSMESWESRLTIDRLTAALPGLSAKGSVVVNLGKGPLATQGTFRNAELNVPEFLKGCLGKHPDVPRPLRRVVDGSGSFSTQGAVLRTTGVRASVDGTSVTGSVRADFSGKEPDLALDLRTPLLDIDRYFPESKATASQKSTPTPSGTGEPWDLSAFTLFSAKGTLRADALKVAKILFTDITAPFSLKGGILSLGTSRGRLCGGRCTATGGIVFGKGLSLHLKSHSEAFSLGALLKARGMKSILKGNATLSADLTADLDRSGQIPARLNGSMHLAIGSGSFQAVDDKGSPKGKPTKFTDAGASGTITNGILRSNDFILRGDGLELKGDGVFNLISATMDMDLTADLRGLPVVPLYVYGPFSDPKTKVKGGEVILNTIGGLFKGIFSTVGAVLSSPFRLFSKPKEEGR